MQRIIRLDHYEVGRERIPGWFLTHSVYNLHVWYTSYHSIWSGELWSILRRHCRDSAGLGSFRCPGRDSDAILTIRLRLIHPPNRSLQVVVSCNGFTPPKKEKNPREIRCFRGPRSKRCVSETYAPTNKSARESRSRKLIPSPWNSISLVELIKSIHFCSMGSFKLE